MKIKLKIMKNILLAFAVVTTFTACNSKKSETRDIQLMSDSTAYTNDMYSDTSNMEIAKEPIAVSSKPHSVAPHTRTTTNSTTTTTTNTTPANSTGTQSTTTQTTTRKKGWSSAAKGAVIGGGAGAIGGAIISKKPVKGAIIGGVVGAAGGYIIGKDIDKKKGR
jgi:hypothetical protein